jgi:hypothetical protein
MSVARPRKTKTKRVPTLLEDQRARVAALQTLLDFALGRRDYDAVSGVTLMQLRHFGGAKLGPEGPDPEQIKELRGWMLDGFTKVADGEQWIVSLSQFQGMDIVISTNGVSYEDRAGQLNPQRWVLAGLLSNENWRAGRCAWPECNQLFMRKKRGAYCSRRCSVLMRTERMRNPRFRSLEKKANKLGVPLSRLWAKNNDSRSTCPKCGALNLNPLLNKIVVTIICSSCKQPFVAEPRRAK